MDQKLGFWQVAKGRLARDLQEDFEKAQMIAFERGVRTKVMLEITVHPPEKGEQNYGNLEYKHQVTEPPKTSIKYPTLLKSGYIVRDAQEPDLLTQLDLDLKLPEEPLPFRPRVVEQGGAE